MSRFIVVAPGSSEAAALATDELARVLGVTTVDALAGTTATDAAPVSYTHLTLPTTSRV